MLSSHEELLAQESGVYAGMWLQQQTRAEAESDEEPTVEAASNEVKPDVHHHHHH